MSSQRIEPGVLVSFCSVETSADLVFAEGLASRHLIDRVMPGRGYFPQPGEVGLVVGGPTSPGGIFTMWEIYVGGRNLWFTEDHLILKTE